MLVGKLIEQGCDNLNKTTVTPFFTSNRVQVLREEEAHPFDSLIADIDAAAGNGTDYTAEMDRKSEELAEKARQRRHASEHATAM